LDADASVAHNRRAHDAVGVLYDERHPEIFNETEQRRLAAAIERAVSLARGTGAVRALDVGCGTGNLASHLIRAGARVTAADLSVKFLRIVEQRFSAPGLERTALLNGTDLEPFGDNQYDLTCAYSVLHHVPDYLRLVREMARVTRPGGIVMIDHERSDESWNSETLTQFRREAVVFPPRVWWRWFDPRRYWRRIHPKLQWRPWRHPRWMPEGDIHIWADDHIEWRDIERTLAEGGCDVVAREQYLLYEPRYVREVWERWNGRAADMQMLLARKRG
jgi:ubiquinone/menaquinone biosynthesis C-methylase UbiE